MSTDPAAPHGRDANGVPLAPYGLNVDGSPRKSNRGARRKGTSSPTSRKSSAPTMATSNLTDDERKQMLCELGDMFFVNPLASLSQIPAVARKIGDRQAGAIAGDAFIISQFMPGLADGAILMAKAKPATLAWLDKIEQNAPYALLISVGLQMVKAVADNHINPNPRVAQAGRALAAMRIQAMADAVNAQAMAQSQGPAAPAYYDEPTTEQFEQAGFNRAMQDA
jgi:hypothetical protein